MCDASGNTVLNIKSLPAEGILLNKGWKYHQGDNPLWAQATFDDHDWQAIDPTQDIYNLPQLWQTNIGWFRLHFSVDNVLSQQSLALLVQQTGATEIYLNGKLIQQLGRISDKPEEVQAMTLLSSDMIGFLIANEPSQVLAVGFALQKKYSFSVFFIFDLLSWMVIGPLHSTILNCLEAASFIYSIHT